MRLTSKDIDTYHYFALDPFIYHLCIGRGSRAAGRLPPEL